MIDTELREEMQWLDVELIVERDIDRAAQYGRKSDRNLWVAGFYAARVIGKYTKDATIAISDRSGKSIATVQNWAHAVWMYQALRLTGNFQLVRHYRRELKLTHFYTLWDKCNKYNLTPEKAMGYLQQMLDYRSQGEPWSADALAREIDAHEDKAGNTPAWSYYKTRMASLLHNAFVSVGIPADIKPLVAEILKRLESRKEAV
jgi:hypothetical protein